MTADEVKNKIKELIKYYEDELRDLETNGNNYCNDCCDYTALGEAEYQISQFVNKLTLLLQ